MYGCVEKKFMTIVCNIWMICLELNWLFYDPSSILQLSEFVWTLRSSARVVFNNFLFIDATDRSKLSSEQNWFFFAVSLNHPSFFANTPFKIGFLTKFYKKCLKEFSFYISILHINISQSHKVKLKVQK